jgi:hypothetical protein
MHDKYCGGAIQNIASVIYPSMELCMQDSGKLGTGTMGRLPILGAEGTKFFSGELLEMPLDSTSTERKVANNA